MGGGDLESEQPKRPYLLETLHRGGGGGGGAGGRDVGKHIQFNAN